VTDRDGNWIEASLVSVGSFAKAGLSRRLVRHSRFGDGKDGFIRFPFL
jgi:hypothetical protein